MLGSPLTALLEEENEVLLARYCMASFLPPFGTTSLPPAPGQGHFRPRWLTAAEESSHQAASALLDGPAEAQAEADSSDDDQQQQSPLLALPEELLWLVWELSRPTAADLCRWSLVCRRFDRVACGHVGLWTPLLPPGADLPALLAITSSADCTDPAAAAPPASSLYHHRVNPKELYRAGRRLQYLRLWRRIEAWMRDVAKATSFDDGEEVVEPENAGEGLEAKRKPGDDDKKACPRALFRDTFVYLRREPLEPLPSFKMFLWDRVIKSLTTRTSEHLEMQLLSTHAPAHALRALPPAPAARSRHQVRRRMELLPLQRTQRHRRRLRGVRPSATAGFAQDQAGQEDLPRVQPSGRPSPHLHRRQDGIRAGDPG